MKIKILLLLLIAACLSVTQSCCKTVCSSVPGTECEEVCPFEKTGVLFYLNKAAIHGSESWRDPLGFQAGADFPVYFINYPLTVRAGALISLQGANWQEGSLEGKTSLWYAYVPVVLRYQHSSGFYGEAGLQPGILLSAQDKYEGTSENYMDYMNRFDLSVPIEVGYNFKNNIGVNFRVTPGITDITQDEDEKDVNFVLGLGLTYTFDLKK